MTEEEPPATVDIEKDVSTEKQPARAHDADEALNAFEELQGEAIELDAGTNKRLLKIIDWHLMPIMCFVYGMNYLDKTTLSYASVMGIKDDLNLVGDQYQWLGSFFYFGYLAWEYPTNVLLQRLPLAVTPGFALLTSQWYTKDEQASRVNIWFSFNGWGQILGGFVAYGIAVGTQRHGSAIESWKIVFLCTGLLTVTLGLIFLWIIPDSQLNARWLKKEDRVLAVARVRVNQQGIGNKHFKFYQVKEALMDPMTWAFFFVALIADIPNGGITNFFNQLITSFGYSEEQSLLYGVPGGAVEVIALIASGYTSHITQQRILCSTGGLICAIVGMVLIVALPLENDVGRLIGYYMTQASPTPFVALLSLVSSNMAGYTKKTTVAALYLIGYCAGNIIGPQVFRPKDAPRYVPAEITIIVCWGVCLLILVFIWCWYKKENNKKAGIRAREDYVRLENQEWLDLTDWENSEFVYSL
ncbi:hypothetical protein SI65_03626 [Aspergillus cristatus]|uniref:Major facilitator superfamily (MFS) profile domain-containing protein n=1 Tax=Aspergillus cristatus TaxID=573508 RepID=A0A1E3BHX8_ASPCR|nr:hypothetical protein SI65_03626 [Aspergillus cristatus]